MNCGTSAMTREEKRGRIIKERCFKPFERFLDLSDYRESIYAELETEGTRLCDEYMPDTPDFFLVESGRSQALTIHDYAVVMVYRGMLDLIFNLASMMAAVTPTPSPIPAKAIMPWRTNMLEWLEQRNFGWDNEEYWWLYSPEHRLVFNSYVMCLFRFVVLHEIGHQHNLHSRRWDEQTDEDRARPQSEDSCSEQRPCMHKVEPDDAERVSIQQNVPSQAREIVADTYAFQFIVEEQFNEFYCPEEDKEKESALAVAAVCFALSVAHLYFWGRAAVAERASVEDIGTQKYPSHLFRIHAIEAAFLQHGFPPMCDVAADVPISLALSQSNERLAAISMKYSFAEWRVGASHPSYQDYYRKICEEVPNWTNGFFGVKDDELIDLVSGATRAEISKSNGPVSR